MLSALGTAGQVGGTAYGAYAQAQANANNLAAAQAHNQLVQGYVQQYLTPQQSPYSQALLQFAGMNQQGQGGVPSMPPGGVTPSGTTPPNTGNVIPPGGTQPTPAGGDYPGAPPGDPSGGKSPPTGGTGAPSPGTGTGGGTGNGGVGTGGSGDWGPGGPPLQFLIQSILSRMGVQGAQAQGAGTTVAQPAGASPTGAANYNPAWGQPAGTDQYGNPISAAGQVANGDSYVNDLMSLPPDQAKAKFGFAYSAKPSDWTQIGVADAQGNVKNAQGSYIANAPPGQAVYAMQGPDGTPHYLDQSFYDKWMTQNGVQPGQSNVSQGYQPPAQGAATPSTVMNLATYGATAGAGVGGTVAQPVTGGADPGATVSGLQMPWTGTTGQPAAPLGNPTGAGSVQPPTQTGGNWLQALLGALNPGGQTPPSTGSPVPGTQPIPGATPPAGTPSGVTPQNGGIDLGGQSMYKYNPQQPFTYQAGQLGQGSQMQFTAPSGGASGTQGFNAGQDGLMQSMRSNMGIDAGQPGGAAGYSPIQNAGLNTAIQNVATNAPQYNTSDLFKSVNALSQNNEDRSVQQLQGSAGSLGQRFGTAMNQNEALLRSQYDVNNAANLQQIGQSSFNNAQQLQQGAQALQSQNVQNLNSNTLQGLTTNLNSANQAGQFNAAAGQTASSQNAQQGNIYNNFMQSILGGASGLQGQQQGSNTSLLGLIAGLAVPQQAGSTYGSAASSIGQIAQLYPFLQQLLGQGQTA